MDTVAVTDHGNMFGAIDLYTEAKAAGVKLIFGCETYVAATDRHDRTNRRNYHLILLAKNDVGYKNLSFLNSKGYLEGFYYNPRIDKQLLREHSEGLIGLSACLGGEIAQTLEKNGVAAAEEVAKEYASIFAPGDFYLELHADADRRAGHAQRRAQADEREARHPARRDQRLPLRQPRRRGGARRADGDPDRQEPQGREAAQARRRQLLHEVAGGDGHARSRTSPRRSRTRSKIAERATSSSSSTRRTCRSTRCPTARRSTRTSRKLVDDGPRAPVPRAAERGIEVRSPTSIASAARPSSASSRRWASRATS